MKTKYFLSVIIMGLALIGSAVNAVNIQYPIAELGNCKNGSDCKIYCDKPVNTNACLDFAKKNNLMSDKEVALAKKFVASGEKGPGGCVGKDSCEQYCNDISHIDECISYAEKNDIMSPQELEEAKKVQSAINKGVKPPACGNKKECDVYCEDPNHMEECINFGIAAGFIKGKELEDSQKMLAAVKRGVKAPPCKGKEVCDTYCSNPDNIEVCINFAIEAGIMSEQEKAGAQGMLQAIKNGVKPPLCKGKEECDAYCQQEDHMEECINFSIASGMMSEKDAKMARKTGGKGPGGCKNADECQKYCESNPDKCKKFQPGPETVNPSGQMMPQQAGPGGCKGPEECNAYCQSNPDVCKNFGPDKGDRKFAPGTGPGKCEGENCSQQQQNKRQPGQKLQPEQNFIPPTGPGAGGNFVPGDVVPQLQPEVQQTQESAPRENPPPPPPPAPAASIINTDSFVGSLISAVIEFLIKH